MTTSLIRFEVTRVRRADNLKHIGEMGRCARCGEPCGMWTKCKPCRMKGYEENARLGPPYGEHFPTPTQAAQSLKVVDFNIEGQAVPWE